MSHNQTETRAEEMWNTFENAGGSRNREASSETIHREKLDGTPFELIGIHGKWFIAMGRYSITEQKDSQEEAIAEITTISYNTIFRMIIAIIEQHEKIKEMLKVQEKEGN